MKSLSAAKLRRIATAVHLELADEELARLLPMVRDLLAVAQKLRHESSVGIDRAGAREPAAHQSG
jgi:hypothetical protein